MHTAISSHTPPGQGDLGRETVVGSTPSIPMMAHITKWEPSSLPFPHTYTLLRCCRRPPSASSSGAIPSAVVHVFVPDFLHGVDQLRSDDRYAATAAPQLEPHVELTLAWTPFWGVPLACLDPARRAWSSTFLPAPVRRKQAQHTPIPPRTQIIVDPGLRCALPPDTTHWAHPQLTDPPMSLRPAGPRATPSTASHEPGLLEYVLFLKVLPVPANLHHQSNVVSNSPVLFSVLARVVLLCSVIAMLCVGVDCVSVNCFCVVNCAVYFISRGLHDAQKGDDTSDTRANALKERSSSVIKCRAYAQDLEWFVLSM